MPLDKLGRPYTALTEADYARMRSTPYPEGFTERSHMLERRQAQLRTEKPIEHDWAGDVRPTPVAATTKRRVNVRRGR